RAHRGDLPRARRERALDRGPGFFPVPGTQNPQPAERMSEDENKLIAERREKLRALQAQGIAFPNDFKPDAFAGDLQREFDDRDSWPAEKVDALARRVKIAGRIMSKRDAGKLAFVHVQDMSG